MRTLRPRRHATLRRLRCERLTDDMEPIDIRFDENTPRAELIEALHHLNFEAKRMQQVVGNPLLPTRWDKAHDVLGELLVLIVGR